MTGVPPLSKSIGWTRGIAEGRNTLLDLQRQLATGKKSATYGGLGPDRTTSLAMRARISSINAFLSTIQMTSVRTNVMDQALTRFAEIGRDIKADANFPAYELTDGDRTSMQVRAQNGLDEALSLLRSDVAGRYLFSGRAIDTNPISSMSAIMDGEGGKAGFKQHLAERRQADLGADGLGRLEVAVAADEVTVGEDVEGSPFGFKLSAITTNIAGATVTQPAGAPPQASISFAGATPQPGNVVRLEVNLPDGTKTEVVLTAAAPGEGGPGMFEIGADADETAANFSAAMTDSLESTASIKLAAASSFAASDDFFNFDADNPPRRIDGPPFDAATGYRDATEQDTVFWYKGDAAPGDARSTSVARIDDQISVGYGARATEEGLRWTIQNLAVLTAETFDSGVESDALRYKEMSSRAARNLAHADGQQTPEAIHTQIASAELTLDKTKGRHNALKATADNLIAKVEEADPNEVAVKILQLQTRLQASYETTSMLSRLSLVYFM